MLPASTRGNASTANSYPGGFQPQYLSQFHEVAQGFIDFACAHGQSAARGKGGDHAGRVRAPGSSAMRREMSFSKGVADSQ